MTAYIKLNIIIVCDILNYLIHEKYIYLIQKLFRSFGNHNIQHNVILVIILIIITIILIRNVTSLSCFDEEITEK